MGGYLTLSPEILGQNPSGSASWNPGAGATLAVERHIGGPEPTQPTVVLGANAAYGYQHYLNISAVGAPGPVIPSATLKDASTGTFTLSAAWNPVGYYSAGKDKLSKTPRLTLFGESSYAYSGTTGTSDHTQSFLIGGGAEYNARLNGGRDIVSAGLFGGARLQFDAVNASTYFAPGGYVGGFVGASWR